MKTQYALRRSFAAVSFVAAVLVFHLLWAGPASAVSGVVEKTSANSFDQTVQKIKKGITANRLVVLKELNHQQMLKMVGVRGPRSIVFEVFHPRYGKQIHANDFRAFMAFPIRIRVQERGRKVVVSYQQSSALLSPYKGLKGLGTELDQLLSNIVGSATK